MLRARCASACDWTNNGACAKEKPQKKTAAINVAKNPSSFFISALTFSRIDADKFKKHRIKSVAHYNIDDIYKSIYRNGWPKRPFDVFVLRNCRNHVDDILRYRVRRPRLEECARCRTHFRAERVVRKYQF